jgi:hypothetical protein
MIAMVNVGLLLAKIRERGFTGFTEAAAICRTSPKNFMKLSRARYHG